MTTEARQDPSTPEDTPRPKRRTGRLIGAGVTSAGFAAGAILGIQNLLGINRGPSSPSDEPNRPLPTAGGPATPGKITPSPEATKTTELPPISRIEFTETAIWQDLSQKEQYAYLDDIAKTETDYLALPPQRRAQLAELTYRMDKPYIDAVLLRYDPSYKTPPLADGKNTNDEVIAWVDMMNAAAYVMQLRDGDAKKFGPLNDDDTDGRSRALVSVNFANSLYTTAINDSRTMVSNLHSFKDLQRKCNDGCTDGLRALADTNEAFSDTQRIFPFAEKATTRTLKGTFELQTFVPIGSKDGKKVSWWQIASIEDGSK